MKAPSAQWAIIRRAVELRKDNPRLGLAEATEMARKQLAREGRAP